MDYYDASMPVVKSHDSEVLKGCAGAAGRIDGIVRVLSSPEEGDMLLPGENKGISIIYVLIGALVTFVSIYITYVLYNKRDLLS